MLTICTMYEKGCSIEEIAKEFGKTYDQIELILRHYYR
jgi:uncharacterized protein (DUF433 family)